MMANGAVFTYTDNLNTYHRVQLDWPACDALFVEVCGDGESASYEWVVLDSAGAVLAQSDDSYGMAGVALRDGLVAVYGVPA